MKIEISFLKNKGRNSRTQKVARDSCTILSSGQVSNFIKRLLFFFKSFLSSFETRHLKIVNFIINYGKLQLFYVSPFYDLG